MRVGTPPRGCENRLSLLLFSVVRDDDRGAGTAKVTGGIFCADRDRVRAAGTHRGIALRAKQNQGGVQSGSDVRERDRNGTYIAVVPIHVTGQLAVAGCIVWLAAGDRADDG